jgi:hypothetical protein
MALTAILPKLVIMGILMAAGTVGVLYTPELLVFFRPCHGNLMAFDTGHALMLPGKLEPCIIMVEF